MKISGSGLFRLVFRVGMIATALCGVSSACAGGDGTLIMFRNPTNYSPRVVSLWGGGGSEQIIMKSDGSVWDWGMNTEGQLGNGTTNNSAVPVQVLGPGGVGLLAPVTAIMGGEIHNFALKSDGTVWSWGWNIFGQLGDGSANWGHNTNYSTTPVQVFGLTSVKALGGRGYHSMALKNDGTVWCWGDNASGQCGNGLFTPSGTNVPVQVVGLTNPVMISGGGFFSLALMPDGTVRSWGDNAHCQCGDGTASNRSTPVQVLGASNITSISAGWFHTLALRSDGTVWSWGNNSSGELGDGTTATRSNAVQVVGLSNIVSVSAGDNNSIALRSDGTVWKWGVNQYGELGNGTIDGGSPHPVPLQVPNLSNVVIAVNRDYHNICVKRDGTVWTWGDNRYGGCGDLTGNPVLFPRLMPGLVSNNTIPYADSFESYASGVSIVGTNFWLAADPSAGIVTSTNYTGGYSGAFPIAGPHQQSLAVNGIVTNRFLPSFYSNVWVDMIVQAEPPTNPAPPLPLALTNASFGVYVTANGHLAVWNCTNAPAPGNGWTELLDTSVSSNQFFRLTVQADYTPDVNGFLRYHVYVNGTPSTNPSASYAAADSSQPWFGDLVAQGHFNLDDLVIATNRPFCALVASTIGSGTISPSGTVVATPGSMNTFNLAANNWFHLASVAVDGVNVGTPVSFTFNNVQADHTIIATYASDLAAQNTPKWWLYQMDTNWAANFDAAALGDQDGDGVPTWQEYIEGTNPGSAASCFALASRITNGRPAISFPTVPADPQSGLHRYYAIQCNTNSLGAPVWQDVPGWTNILAGGQTVTFTNLSPGSNLFLRGRVWLAP